MSDKPIGRLIFLRHGQTDYTDSEFDLTPEGVKTIEATAVYLVGILKGFVVRLFSSPKPRAKTTAFVIGEELGPLVAESKVDRHLTSIGIRDSTKAKALFDEYAVQGGVNSADSGYLTDARFNDPQICEPWDSTRKRFYWYLGRLIEGLFNKRNNGSGNGQPECVICVTHYELLCHFVFDLFGIGMSKDDCLKHGEIIDVQVLETEKKNTARLEVNFRSKQASILFEAFEEPVGNVA